MSIEIGPIRLQDPVILAPMSGVTDLPFRRLVKRHGAGLVISEMIASEAMIRQTRQSVAMATNCPEEQPMAVQLAGCEPAVMAEAAKLNADRGAALIDINFGCPVKKVVKRNGGSGCLKDLGLVAQVIQAVAAQTHLPVTVKIRSGWSEEMRDPVSIALRCQDAGARALTLHPRTRAQMYTGAARWDEIAAVVEALDIPVIGNGDIRSAADAARMHRETGCAAVMIARGSFGQPWVFTQARALLNGTPVPPTPPVSERFAVALRHARMAADYEADPRGAAIEFRKHLGWYVKGIPGSAELRQQLHAVDSFDQVAGLFADYLDRSARYAAADATPEPDGELVGVGASHP
jgi:tRNA-dihydrouridine synthase B